MNENQIAPAPQDSDEGKKLNSAIVSDEAELAAAAKLRKNSRVVEIAVFAFLVLLYSVSLHVHIPFLSEDSINHYYLPGLEILIFGAALYSLIQEVRFRIETARRDAECEASKVRKRLVEHLPSEARPETKDYFDALVRINVDNLAGYYSLVKVHTNNSFVAALAMGVAGFVLVAMGLVLGFTSSKQTTLMPYISSGAGVMSEFIAAVFFYLYNRTVQQMKGYHDSLLEVQNVLLALKLVNDTQQPTDRIKMIGQMLAYLLTRRTAAEPEQASPSQVQLARAAGTR